MFQDPVQRYIDLTRELHELRKRTGDADCPEEDALLDQMEGAWRDLTPEDIQHIESLGVPTSGERS